MNRESIKKALKRSPTLHRLARRTYSSAQRLIIRNRTGRRLLAECVSRVQGLVPRKLPKHIADVQFAAILDGTTLNLDLALPISPSRGINHIAQIVFTSGQTRYAVSARIRKFEENLAWVSATISLGPSGVPVHTRKKWQLKCALHESTGVVEYALRGAPVVDWDSGPTIIEPRCRETGYRYQIGTGEVGLTRLFVQPPRKAAEITHLDLTWSNARIHMRTVGFTVTNNATVRLVSRAGDSIDVGTTVIGDRVNCALPVRALATTQSHLETIWDVFLLTDTQRVRISSDLFGLSNPKAVLRPSAKIVASDIGSAVRVRPYFTLTGKLALACLLVGAQPSCTPQGQSQ